jgi:hypothetical protein
LLATILRATAALRSGREGVWRVWHLPQTWGEKPVCLPSGAEAYTVPAQLAPLER